MDYFHLLTNEQYKELEGSNATWADVMDNYKQPEWCTYPLALNGEMGCWSLVYRWVTGEESCKGCELYKPRVEQ